MICGVCGRKERTYPMSMTVCGDCLSQIYANGGRYIITNRKLIGGFCDLEGKIKWNTSTINVRICKDCMNRVVKQGRSYKTEKDRYLGRMNRAINPR